MTSRATALHAVQQVSPIFQQIGFARDIILDNDLTYVASHELDESLVP